MLAFSQFQKMVKLFCCADVAAGQILYITDMIFWNFFYLYVILFSQTNVDY